MEGNQNIDSNYKKSIELWTKSQENYIEELEKNKSFAVRDVDHYDVMIEHEKKVLKDYLDSIEVNE